MKKLIICILVMLPGTLAGTCYSRRALRYVDWYRGSDNTNVIISAPHDGQLKPDYIPDRIRGCYDVTTNKCDYHHDCADKGGVRNDTKCKPVTNSDWLSSKLAMEMRTAISLVTGETPHMIVSALHRSKLDPNRFRDDAAHYDRNAGRAYDLFHGYIQKAHNLVNGRDGSPGIHFDIHGYVTHAADNWTEIGYNIPGTYLNNNTLDYNMSSIRSLAARTATPFPSLLSGNDSLGWLFQQLDYRTVPSPQYPRPNTGTPGKYFRGGYITRKWGSLTEGNIDCIQIEFAQWTRDAYKEHGPKLGEAMGQFIKTNYPN